MVWCSDHATGWKPSIQSCHWCWVVEGTGSNRQDHRALSDTTKIMFGISQQILSLKLLAMPVDVYVLLAVKIQECILINNYWVRGTIPTTNYQPVECNWIINLLKMQLWAVEDDKCLAVTGLTVLISGSIIMITATHQLNSHHLHLGTHHDTIIIWCAKLIIS